MDEDTKKAEMIIPQSVRNTGWYKSSGITSSQVFNLYLDSKIERRDLFSIGADSNFLIGSSPIVHDEKVLALGTDGIIKSYNLTTEEIAWQNDSFKDLSKKGFLDQLSSNYLSGGMSYSEGFVYATSGAGAVIAINAKTGESVWSAQLSSPSRATPLKTIKDVLIVQASDNKTFALSSKTGAILWTHIGISEEITSLRTSAPVANNNSAVSYTHLTLPTTPYV